jgi:hypothetical protein
MTGPRTFPLGTLAIANTTSGNRKIGHAGTTYAAQGSCPTSCRFRDGGGCYAEAGTIGQFVTRPLNAAAEDASALEIALAEARAIDELQVADNAGTVGRPLRLHTVGDCPDEQCARVVAAAAERYMDRGGGPVWTYTHAWADVERASWGRVSVLASCETVEDVEAARARGYATAIVVDEHPSECLYQLSASAMGARHYPATAGAEILPCPQQTRDVACTDCRLCFDDQGIRERGYSIGFEIHGAQVTRRRAKLALVDPDNPTRKLSSRILIPQLEAEAALEGRTLSNREIAERLGMNESSVYEMRRALAGNPRNPRRRKVAA